MIRDEYIYESMLKKVYTEFADLCMTYLEDDKIKRIQEVGRTKAHGQKKRAKDGIKELKTEGEQELFVLGCYDELKYTLLRQLYRVMGEGNDYTMADKFLTETVEEEKENFKTEIKKG